MTDKKEVKLNKDGLEAGKPVSEADLQKHISKQRLAQTKIIKQKSQPKKG